MRKNIGTALGIEHRCRLVEHEIRGLHRERPGEREPLLLAAGEQVRLARLEPGQADRRKRVRDTTADHIAREPEVLGPERHVVLDRCRDDLVVGVLKHDPDQFAQLADARLVGRRDAVDRDGARLWQQDTVREARERRLAGTVGAQHGDLRAGRDRRTTRRRARARPAVRRGRRRRCRRSAARSPWSGLGRNIRSEHEEGLPREALTSYSLCAIARTRI